MSERNHHALRPVCQYLSARTRPACRNSLELEAFKRLFEQPLDRFVVLLRIALDRARFVDFEYGGRDAFRQAGHTATDVGRWFRPIRLRLHLDLWTANRDQLVAAGLRPDRIFTCGLSTLAHQDVFESHRADGESAGRMAALIVVPA